MANEKPQVKGPAKGIRVSPETHAAIRRYMHKIHADSMDEALSALVGESTIHIPMPPEVMTRWEAEAQSSGFSLPQWVAQRVEGYLANRAYAGEVRAALNELAMLRRGPTPPRPQSERLGEHEQTEPGAGRP